MVNCDMDHIPTFGLMGLMLHRMMNRARSMYQEFDLNRSQASVLFSLHQKKSMSQKELAVQLNMTPPSITSTIQKMERSGYISRKPDQSDQRIMRLELTGKGESCIRTVKMITDQMEEMLFRGMSAEEKILFRRFLMQINDNLAEDQNERGKHTEIN
ncbi:MAG TPA: MarR family transcriptional regulator [Candidatus Mediterraneibacter stercoripullorum]|nr:MarR family transcriptional regulator [Candidatus Mediterraneibacter stercoripullorum]